MACRELANLREATTVRPTNSLTKSSAFFDKGRCGMLLEFLPSNSLKLQQAQSIVLDHVYDLRDLA